MTESTRFDDFFFTITKETGGLEGLLQAMFSFLHRRTDFYYEADPGDKMGFPPGYAQRLLLTISDKYQQEHWKKHPKKDPKEYQDKAKKYQEKLQQEKEAKQSQPNSAPTIENKPEPNVKFVTNDVFESAEAPKPKKTSEDNKEESDIKPSNKTSSISTYNGASTQKYNWSQGSSDVTVQVPLPEGTRAKQLQVDYTSSHLKVVLKPKTLLIEGDWYDKIKPEDSTWSIDGNSLVIVLEKMGENIWKTVLKGDQEIDATKVDNSKPLQDFDTETQAALRKIMYEQQRKQMGLPTSEEENQMEMLKKAWDAEGSPFKGTPFDPSKINLPGSNFTMPNNE